MASEVTLRATHLIEWPNMHYRLGEIMTYAINLWPEKLMRVTSMNRSKDLDASLGGSGIHSAGPPWRAIDIGARFLSQEQLDDIGAIINDIWQYDPFRPHLKVAVTKQHGTGRHLHLQVHPNTRRRPHHDAATRIV